IDDMGGTLRSARRLLALGIPLTFSILPNTPEAPQVAELAHRSGTEVIIHIPMEPQGYPAINPGKGALMVGMPAKKIRTLFAGYRQRVPYAVGGNNHEGSLFTEQVAGMDTVLEEMKKDGLFFVDSLTTAQSVGYREARRLGVPTAVRDRFLDNKLNVGKISRQIEKLVQLAKRQGHAIAICHPHPQTIEALEHEASYLKNAGVEFVPVSQMVN
ncbi:MAG TPA: divergent polysaccharide deacetylase family protein, partial [Desulfuromonadales bacterium]|nr:divergent polysaccharide deacetylase family protein [Desulfuromonadales bacterium]